MQAKKNYRNEINNAKNYNVTKLSSQIYIREQDVLETGICLPSSGKRTHSVGPLWR
jgi:hypothetical protein